MTHVPETRTRSLLGGDPIVGSLVRAVVAVFALAGLLASTAAAGPVALSPGESPPSSPQRPARANLDEFEKLDEDDLAETYQDWLETVHVIITPDEKDAFLRMESDIQRDEFIKRFWAMRDPSAGTPQNEYKDEYERRLEHVEKHFGRGQPRPGWMTDRGRMYLLLGEPMNTKSLPNTQLAYPVEIWWYHANPKLGIPPFFYLAFFKRNGVGEYRLYSPLMDGPRALLNPAGLSQADQLLNQTNGRPSVNEGEIGTAYDVLLEVDAELAQVSLSLVPGDYGGLAGFSSMRSMMMIGDIENIPQRIMPNASWAYPILTGIVEADVRFESLPLSATAVALLDPSGVPFVHYGVLTEGGRLNLNSYEDKWYVTFEVAGSLVDDQNRVITGVQGAAGEAAKILQADLDREEARRLRGGPLVYMDRFPVVDGSYAFDLVVENNVSREYGRSRTRIDVPQPWPERLRSSRAMLLWGVFENEDYDPFGQYYPFQIGPYGLIPSFDHSFSIADDLHVFHQVYLPRGHNERITVSYRLESEGEAVIDRSEFLNPADADRSGAINHPSSIDLDGVSPGEYELIVDIEGDDRGPERVSVTIGDRPPEDPIPYMHMSPGPPPTDPFFAFDRAQQLRTLGLIDEAIDVLEPAVARVPDDEVLDLHLGLLLEAERYPDIEQLVRPKLIEDPNNVALLNAAAEASSRMGRTYDTIRYYERIRLIQEEETTQVLNPLASAYFGEGQRDKAREILELSLGINPDQPEVRRLLSEVLGRQQ